MIATAAELVLVVVLLLGVVLLCLPMILERRPPDRPTDRLSDRAMRPYRGDEDKDDDDDPNREADHIWRNR